MANQVGPAGRLVPISVALIGVANGVAGLDSGGKVPSSQLPASVAGALNYAGTWNASTNTPTLGNSGAGGVLGDFRKVSIAGSTSLDGITQWNVGDLAINNGTTWDKINGLAAEVISVHGRTGVVSAQTGDYTVSQVTGAAPLASPTLTGSPVAPTPSTGDNSALIATTAFVKAQNYITSAGAPVQSVLGRTGAVVATAGDYSVAQVTGAAPLASPALTGSPTAPTPSTGDNSTLISTTAFVKAQSYITSSGAPVQSVHGRTGTVSAQTGDYAVAQVTGAAPLASPTFTGSVVAPTPTTGDNSTLVATTAFVKAQSYITSAGAPVQSVHGRTGTVSAQTGDYTVSQVTGAAPLASPTFTGSVTIPTPSTGDNSTLAASTAFVKAQSYITSAGAPVQSVLGRSGAVVAAAGDYTLAQIKLPHTGNETTDIFADVTIVGAWFYPEKYGADPTGVSDSTTAINNCFIDAAAAGGRVFGKVAATYKATAPINANCGFDLSQCTLDYGTNYNSVGIKIGVDSAYIIHKEFRCPKMNFTKSATGWGAVSSAIAVVAQNLQNCRIYTNNFINWAEGLRISANNNGGAKGNSYNQAYHGHYENCAIALHVLADDTTSWANEWDHYGGRASMYSGEGSNVSGTRSVLIETPASGSLVNNHSFHRWNFEGNGFEYHCENKGASYNTFEACRWEATSPKFYDNGLDATRVSQYNLIIGGYFTGGITYTQSASNGGKSAIISAQQITFVSGGSNGSLRTYNSSSDTSPCICLFPNSAGGAGIHSAGGTAAWLVGIGASYIELKSATGDTQPGIRIDSANRRIMFGPGGSTAPTTYIKGSADTVQVLRFSAPATAPNLGNLSASEVNLYLDETGNNIKLGLKNSGSGTFTATIPVHSPLFTQTADKTVANTTTPTTLLGTVTGTKTIPANVLTVAKQGELDMTGVVSTTGTPTNQFQLKLGSVVIADTGAVAMIGTLSNVPVKIKGRFTVRTAGASGTVKGSIEVTYVDSTGAVHIIGDANTAAQTVDGTATQVVDLLQTWGTQSSSNTITTGQGQLKLIGG